MIHSKRRSDATRRRREWMQVALEMVPWGLDYVIPLDEESRVMALNSFGLI